MTAFVVARAVVAVLCVWLMGTSGWAATFAPIAGSLAIRAGNKAAQTTPVVIGAASLSDNSFPQGVDFATASLIAAIPQANRFTFSGSASSSTNATAPAGQTQATASVVFQQSFTTTEPRWLELVGQVLSPPAQPNVFATLTLSRAGQPAPVFVLGDTAGEPAHRGAAAPAGTFALSGSIDTTAPKPGSFAGAFSGYLFIARLGDFNGDAVVGGADLPTWKTGFGSTTGTFASGNLDEDGDTDGADFLLWQRQFGSPASLAATSLAVPEPHVAAWPLLLWAYAARRRGRREPLHCRT
ncbi:MAG: hypothetical protein DCC67_14105 [Planctomycetota bacterium]|nr:MAG: hypothetical protein DCC67_14105 [Planctomycetota bacterium]